MAYRPGMALTSASPDLTGRRALVTGGTRGIGAATARRLADAGAEVVVAARTVPAGGGPRGIAADLSTAEGVATVSRRTLELLGGLDILVSNAGGQTHRPEGALGFSDEDWQRDLDLNLMAAVRLDRALLLALAETGQGAIVHVASRVPRRPSGVAALLGGQGSARRLQQRSGSRGRAPGSAGQPRVAGRNPH